LASTWLHRAQLVAAVLGIADFGRPLHSETDEVGPLQPTGSLPAVQAAAAETAKALQLRQSTPVPHAYVPPADLHSSPAADPAVTTGSGTGSDLDFVEAELVARRKAAHLLKVRFSTSMHPCVVGHVPRVRSHFLPAVEERACRLLTRAMRCTMAGAAHSGPPGWPITVEP
jgi:hypothetical protein